MTPAPLEVPVSLGARSYKVVIGEGILAGAGARLRALSPARRVAIVTDETVGALHLAALERALDKASPPFLRHSITMPPGEGSKSFAGLEHLTDALLAAQLTRQDLVVALGGGVIGDLAGFAAAILKRGVAFMQVPTTLLAMVDSSVGGKTAINVRAGKNLIGAFHQPVAVLADLALLATLPDRELRAGYAETVKYGLIHAPDFFRWCEENAPALLRRDHAATATAVAQSVRSKAQIVAEDEFETTGARALLNLGHTFGHALEAETGFSDRLLHGEAVAIGMALAFAFSARLGLCPADDAARVRRHLRENGLMAHPADAGIAADAAPRLVHHMLQDKKRTTSGLPFILAHGIGNAYVARDIPLDQVEIWLGQILAQGGYEGDQDA